MLQETVRVSQQVLATGIELINYTDMRKLLLILLTTLCLQSWGQSKFYVATNGNDSNPGTIDQPFATFQRAIDATSAAGDTVFFRGGTYYSTLRNEINPEDSKGASGEYGNPIVYMSYPGEWAIFDCSLHCGLGFEYNEFLTFTYVEHIHVIDMEVKNVFQCGAVNNGVFTWSYSRNLEFHHVLIHDLSVPRGFWGGGGAWYTHWIDPNYGNSDPDGEPYWPTSVDTTRFINVDIWNTCDTLGGGNAGDGWKNVWYGNNHVEWKNCRVWNYSDDGIDPNNIDGATFVVENTWLMSTDKYEIYDIEGNGSKFTAMLGQNSVHNDSHHFLVFKNNIIADNHGFGIYDNLLGNQQFKLNTYLYGNVIYDNNYGFKYDTTTTFINNIAYSNTSNTLANATYSQGGANTFSLINYQDSLAFNAWDFLSLDLNEITWPRKADGSLPDVNLFKLRSGSKFINVGLPPKTTDGVNIVIDSAGHTPLAYDVGAWEYVPFSGTTPKDILSFTFPPYQSGYATYDYDNHTVTALIKYRYRSMITNLAAIILPSDGDTIAGGFMTARNYNSPVTVNVHPVDDDADIQAWTINIDTAQGSSLANIRTFWMANFTNNILPDNATVECYYTPGANISSLTPTISLDIDATSNIASVTPHDFTTGPLVFNVTAEDEVTVKEWTINLTELEQANSDGILGYDIVLPEFNTTTWTAYSPVIAGENGDIQSLSIYHAGGNGNLLMGVYSDVSNDSITRLGVTAATPVNAEEGWQTVNLLTPVSVTTGQTIYLAYVFQTNPGYGVLFNVGLDAQAGYNPRGTGFAEGLISTVVSPLNWNFLTSVYANYTGGAPSTATDITAFSVSGQTGSSTINSTAHTIAVTMPYGTTVTSLTPTISVSAGATIDPTSGTARNFTSPVTYTVTAADETTTQDWVVTVTVASAPPSSGAGLRQGRQLNLGRAIKYGTKYLIIEP